MSSQVTSPGARTGRAVCGERGAGQAQRGAGRLAGPTLRATPAHIRIVSTGSAPGVGLEPTTCRSRVTRSDDRASRAPLQTFLTFLLG